MFRPILAMSMLEKVSLGTNWEKVFPRKQLGFAETPRKSGSSFSSSALAVKAIMIRTLALFFPSSAEMQSSYLEPNRKTCLSRRCFRHHGVHDLKFHLEESKCFFQ